MTEHNATQNTDHLTTRQLWTIQKLDTFSIRVPTELFLNLFPGYGVELQIKSSEYKAQDDRKVQAEGESGEDLTDEHVTFYFIQDGLRLSARIAVSVVDDNC